MQRSEKLRRKKVRLLIYSHRKGRKKKAAIMNGPIVFLITPAALAILLLSWSSVVCSSSELDCPSPNPPRPPTPPPAPNPPCPPSPPPAPPPTPPPPPCPPPPTPRISCHKVEKKLKPCFHYISGKTKNPSVRCCKGVKRITKHVKTKAGKSALCSCIQKCLKYFDDYDKNCIPAIPKICGIKFTLPPIDAQTKCSK